jgi:hypothetical protein
MSKRKLDINKSIEDTLASAAETIARIVRAKPDIEFLNGLLDKHDAIQEGWICCLYSRIDLDITLSTDQRFKDFESLLEEIEANGWTLDLNNSMDNETLRARNFNFTKPDHFNIRIGLLFDNSRFCRLEQTFELQTNEVRVVTSSKIVCDDEEIDQSLQAGDQL